MKTSLITVLIFFAFGLFYFGLIERSGVSFGNYYLDRKNYEAAYRSFSFALETNPESIEALKGFGEVHLFNRQFTLAEFDYRTILTIDPQNAKAYCGLGIVAYESGNIDLAVNCFDRALKEKPDYRVAINWRKKCKRR